MFVLPAYNEGFPVAIIEAMSAGLPIISTPVGGIPDVIEEGTNGFLVEPGDAEAIADRIVNLLNNRALNHNMGKQNAMKALANFDVSIVVNALCKIYEQTLKMY